MSNKVMGVARGTVVDAAFPVSVLYLSVPDWCSVPGNPRQRDTEKHAKKALRSHLRHASPEHAQVSAAQLPNGQLIKLDGHTRAFLWENGLLEPPPQVLVSVVRVENEDRAKELYKHFDNASATEHLADQIDGALREHQIVLRSGGFSKLYASSLRQANALVFPGEKRVDLYDIVGRWKPLLLAVDALGYGRTLAAAQTILLLSFVRYANRRQILAVVEFWNQFFDGAKSAQARHWLPSEALRHVLNVEKQRGAGNASTERWMRYAALALERHMAQKQYLGKDAPNALLSDAESVGRELLVDWVQPARDLLKVHDLEEVSQFLRESVARHAATMAKIGGGS